MSRQEKCDPYSRNKSNSVDEMAQILDLVDIMNNLRFKGKYSEQ